jgi:hypothetical protein
VLSSLHWSTMRQMGLADLFLFAPYIALFLFRILEGDTRWRNWIALAGFFGATAQSYFFVGPSLLVLFVLAGYAIVRRQALVRIVMERGAWRKIAVCALIVGALGLPNLSLLAGSTRMVLPLRMAPPLSEPHGGPVLYEPAAESKEVRGVAMPYSLVYKTGTFSSVWDFIQLMAPFATDLGLSRNPMRTWGQPSEAFMYIGLVPYCLALLGLLVGAHALKRIWVVVAIAFGLLMLGPEAGLHPILFWLFPPIRFIRHTHALALFFTLAVLYFFVLGLDRLLDGWRGEEDARQRGRPPLWSRAPWMGGSAAAVVVGVVIVVIGLVVGALEYPFRFYQLPLIALLAFVLWRARLTLGNTTLFWSLLTSHVLLVAWSSRTTRIDWRYLLFLGLFLVVPLIVWFASPDESHRRRRTVWLAAAICVVALIAAVADPKLAGTIPGRVRWTWEVVCWIGPAVMMLALLVSPAVRRRAQPLMPLALLVIVAADLTFYSARLAGLAGVERPDRHLSYEASPQPPAFPATRAVFPDYPWENTGGQLIRYQSVLDHVATAFNPLLDDRDRRVSASASSIDRIEMALAGRRLNSFLMFRGYFSIVQARPPATVVAQIFAIDHPLIQLRDGWARAKDHEAIQIFNDEPGDVVSRWLEHAVFLSPPMATSPQGMSAWPLPGGAVPPVTRIPENAISVAAYDYNSLRLAVETTTSRLLYWADGYDSEWRAFVDGRRVPVYRANLNFKAITVPSGRHEVTFEYEPSLFRLALITWWTVQAMLVAAGLALAALALRRQAAAVSIAAHHLR